MAWEPMASSSVNFCQKTRTVQSKPARSCWKEPVQLSVSRSPPTTPMFITCVQDLVLPNQHPYGLLSVRTPAAFVTFGGIQFQAEQLSCLRCCDVIESVNSKRQWSLEMYAIGVPTPARFKRAGVGTNGILECKILVENEHHAHSKQGRMHQWCLVRACSGAKEEGGEEGERERGTARGEVVRDGVVKPAVREFGCL
jgi:hypothetical protein